MSNVKQKIISIIVCVCIFFTMSVTSSLSCTSYIKTNSQRIFEMQDNSVSSEEDLKSFENSTSAGWIVTLLIIIGTAAVSAITTHYVEKMFNNADDAISSLLNSSKDVGVLKKDGSKVTKMVLMSKEFNPQNSDNWVGINAYNKASMVKAMQKFANKALRKSLIIDGICGTKTISAIKDVQRAVDVERDGIAGYKTYIAMARK